ncbi:MAG: hypothetical protein HY914_07245 [Desulfomonile tiedjei]|nr:hypothetical protein [Desulfomonile tiedjei]
MTDIGHIRAATVVEAAVPFRFKVVHGVDPSRKSSEQKAMTKSVSMTGLVFEIGGVEVDGMHISFTEESFGRNFLEIHLEVGRKFEAIRVMGQVEWYEARLSRMAHVFVVGVIFVDIQPDAIVILREYLRSLQGLLR